MQQSPHPSHWHFAYAAAFALLDKLIWGFDSFNQDVERRGHAFAGVYTPEELINIIDGFLSEREKLPGGNVARLEKARSYLQDRLVSIYRAGQEAALQRWKKGIS